LLSVTMRTPASTSARRPGATSGCGSRSAIAPTTCSADSNALPRRLSSLSIEASVSTPMMRNPRGLRPR
jgi:hypothetical protein